MPEITVLMPVYNASKYLREAMDSILNQTFKDFELLIINDGSTDDSEDIIKSYKDPRIRLINNETNMKLIATLNKGIALSKGKYIARMDSDDISHPKRLELQYKLMEENKNIAVCGTGMKFIGKHSKTTVIEAPDQIRNCLRVYNCMYHPTVMLRRSILVENNYNYNKNYIHAEDYHLFQLLSERFDIVNIGTPLLNYRVSPEGISRVHNTEQRYMADNISMEALERIGIHFDRHRYPEKRLAKKEIVEIRDELEKIMKDLHSNDKDIIQVQNLLWFDYAFRGTMYGKWMIRTYLSSTITKLNTIHRKRLIVFFLKCLLHK